MHVEPQTLRVQEQLVLAAALLQDLRNVPRVLDLAQLDVALALLDRLADKLRRPRLTLRAHNKRLLLLACFVDQERGALGLLLGDLLRFDGRGEFGREGQVLQD